MNAMTETSAARAEKLEGIGCKRKRVEDVRFTQGKGNYVDDINLPDMLYGDLVRSPYAHARIKSIDTSKAEKVPGVVAVITAETLKTVNLAWMPTLAGDVQMVLADGKVLFQNQEVAFVVATSRYAAADGVEAVEVDYESLPVNVDPMKAMAPDAPVIREDLQGKNSGAHGPRKHHNHIFAWEAGSKAAADAAFEKADVTIKEFIQYPRCHPCPLETCQCVASFDKIRGELTLWGTFQAPHVIRTVGLADLQDPRAQDPRDRAGYRRRLRQQGRRLFRLHLRDRRLDRDRPAGEVDGGPYREPLLDGIRARLPHGNGDRLHQGRQDHRATRSTPSPTMAPSTPAPTPRNGRRGSSRSYRARTTSRPPIASWTASTPTRRRAASPTAARSVSPRRLTPSSAPWTSWRRSSAWILSTSA